MAYVLLVIYRSHQHRQCQNWGDGGGPSFDVRPILSLVDRVPRYIYFGRDPEQVKIPPASYCDDITNNSISMLLSKTRPSVYLPFMMVLWGIVTSCMAAVQSYKHLLALRTVLGFLEASFNPGVYLILSSWYQKEEQSKRFAIYLSADIIAGAFGGLLAGSVISNLEGSRGIRGWRWLFIIEGVVSIIWAVASHFLLLDFPATSSKLTKDERALAVSRLKVDNNAVGRSPLKPVQVRYSG